MGSQFMLASSVDLKLSGQALRPPKTQGNRYAGKGANAPDRAPLHASWRAQVIL
jgi:hypothetical protein